MTFCGGCLCLNMNLLAALLHQFLHQLLALFHLRYDVPALLVPVDTRQKGRYATLHHRNKIPLHGFEQSSLSVKDIHILRLATGKPSPSKKNSWEAIHFLWVMFVFLLLPPIGPMKRPSFYQCLWNTYFSWHKIYGPWESPIRKMPIGNWNECNEKRQCDKCFSEESIYKRTNYFTIVPSLAHTTFWVM